MLGTNVKRYRPWPSGIPALGDLLTFSCGARTTWSWDVTKPGWLKQSDAHQTITCLIRMHCACLHVENFAAPSLDLSSCSLLLLYKKPLSPLRCGGGLYDTSPPSFRRWTLWREFPIFQVAGICKETAFLYISTCLSSTGFQGGSWTCVRLHEVMFMRLCDY